MKRIACFLALLGCAVCAAQEELPPLPGVLDLEAAQRIALRGNPALQAASARVEQARARVDQARSRYFPQVEASYTASRTWLSDRVVKDRQELAARQAALAGASRYQQERARSAVPEEADNYQLGVTAAYVIFDGFSRKFSNAAARYGEREVEAAREEAQRLLLDAVARAFHGVQLARENVEIARADTAFNERQLKDALASQRVGRGSLSDVLNFQVRLRAAKAAVLQGQNEFAVARVALAALMGLPDAALDDSVEMASLGEEGEAELTPPVLEEAMTVAKELRPDLALSRHSVARAEAQLGERKSAYYPQVSAFVSENLSRSDNNGFDEADAAATVGLQVSYTLFAGGRNRAAVREARHALDEAELGLTDAELNAASEVRQAVLDVLTAEEQLKLQRETADYVERNRDLVEKAYRAGGREASLTRLNQAQRDLTEAQGRLAQARVALRQAWHTLRTATGETLAALDEETAEQDN